PAASAAPSSSDSTGSLDPAVSPGSPGSRGLAGWLRSPGSRASLDSAEPLDSADLLPPEIPTTLGKRLPLAAPPRTNPGTHMAAAELPPALPPPPPPGRSHAEPGDRADGAMPPGAIAKHTPPAIPAVQPPARTKPVPAPLDAFPAGPEAPPDAPAEQRPSMRVPPSGPQAALGMSSGPQAALGMSSGPQAALGGAAGSQIALGMSSGPLPRTTSSGIAIAAADSHGSLRSSASHRAPVERHGWPFYAVIGGAALAGSIAVMLVMRSGTTEGNATSAPGAASLAVRPADNAASPSPPSAITVVPIEQVADPASAAARGAAKPVTDEHAPVDPSLASAGTAPKGSRPVRAAAPPALPTTKREHENEIARLYAAGLYDKVVEQCGAGPLSAEQAPLCFLAACHARNEARARKWIVAVPSSKREQLVVNCM